ncbi:hypothetical protein A3Q56_06791 [Intoshia linei]|uniref:Anticodon-binding domain-containing protein n=1 Tax=Intoshia linei TaxID=1819745 RepID=A0A177AVT0_9BILA|nr:hypothetical protein A3Q56_06791 [Intoshia linei]
MEVNVIYVYDYYLYANYHITNKIRNETHPKNNFFRSREFLMKDLYTFDENDESAKITYENINEAYEKIFDFFNLKFFKVQTKDTIMGGEISHEYLMESKYGEDKIFRCKLCQHVNKNVKICWKCKNSNYTEKNVSEIGHSFLLGNKYTKIFNCGSIPYSMGCFGIGVTRLFSHLSTFNDDFIMWHKSIAPFDITIIPQKIGYDAETVQLQCDKLVNELCKHYPQCSILIDNVCKTSIGHRFKHFSKIGTSPIFIVVSGKCENGEIYEYINVADKTNHKISIDSVINLMNKNYN